MYSLPCKLLSGAFRYVGPFTFHRQIGEIGVLDRAAQLCSIGLDISNSFSFGVQASVAVVSLLPLESWIGGTLSHAFAQFCVHAGFSVLAKYLLQMSVFASIVQALVPFWDPNHPARAPMLTPDAKCRVCLESSPDLRRCPCLCTGSVGYIHPMCFQQWFERKKSLRCELCHVIFQVGVLPRFRLFGPMKIICSETAMH